MHSINESMICKYCGVQWSAQLMKTPCTKRKLFVCAECGTEFQSKTRNNLAKYCSVPCRKKYYDKILQAERAVLVAKKDKARQARLPYLLTPIKDPTLLERKLKDALRKLADATGN